MVYLFRLESTPYYKVGVTDDVEQRRISVQTACPMRVELYLTFEGGIIEESTIHAALNDYHLSGEWFFIPTSPVRFIRHRLWREGQRIDALEDQLEPLPERIPGQRLPPEYTWEIQILRSQGKTYPEIAEVTGVSQWSVKNCCAKGYKYNTIRMRSEKQRQKRRDKND